VDVVVAIVEAPWGPLHLAAGPAGVVALESRTVDDLFEAALRRRGFEPLAASRTRTAGAAARHARAAAGALERHLGGDAVALTPIAVDVSRSAAFDREVFAAVRTIPWGSATSYGRLARRVGRPGAARAVGGAVGRCPVGLLVPCHRVVAGDGTLGGYGIGWDGAAGSLDVKRELLRLEGISLPVAALID
jgi:methylated-DNA-[protein]-cysteine S-methyltransferase